MLTGACAVIRMNTVVKLLDCALTGACAVIRMNTVVKFMSIICKINYLCRILSSYICMFQIFIYAFLSVVHIYKFSFLCVIIHFHAFTPLFPKLSLEILFYFLVSDCGFLVIENTFDIKFIEQDKQNMVEFLFVMSFDHLKTEIISKNV